MSDNKKKSKDNKPKTSQPAQDETEFKPRSVNSSRMNIFELNVDKDKH